MKYECLDCKKTFIYAAKKTTLLISDAKDLLVAMRNLTIPSSQFETHVCPYCQSLNIDEQIETQPNINSVISVPIEDVDAKLKEDYVVRELYAKTATLVKLDKKESAL